jgi:hypothetical protein
MGCRYMHLGQTSSKMGKHGQTWSKRDQNVINIWAEPGCAPAQPPPLLARPLANQTAHPAIARPGQALPAMTRPGRARHRAKSLLDNPAPAAVAAVAAALVPTAAGPSHTPFATGGGRRGRWRLGNGGEEVRVHLCSKRGQIVVEY